jgi:hypothetical protein
MRHSICGYALESAVFRADGNAVRTESCPLNTVASGCELRAAGEALAAFYRLRGPGRRPGGRAGYAR